MYNLCVLFNRNEQETHKKIKIYRYDYSVFKTQLNIDFDFGRSLKNVENPNSLVVEKIRIERAMAIYTDGSKVKGAKSVGLACICPELNIQICKSLPGKSSIFTAESAAILEAVKIAETNPDRKTIIFSDSQSVLRSLGRNKMSIKESSFILEIKKRITKCSENSQLIQLCWIPSHLGVGGNEEADELAKAAADISIHNIKKIPFSDFYQYFAEEANKNTKKYTLDLGISKGKSTFKISLLHTLDLGSKTKAFREILL